MDNLRGAALMTLAMLGFAIEDMIIKLMAGALPTWQIIGLMGIGGASVFALLTRWRGQALFPRAAISPVAADSTYPSTPVIWPASRILGSFRRRSEASR